MELFGRKTYNLLLQQKARSKLSEFDVPSSEYPSLSNEIDNLVIPSHFALLKHSLYLFKNNEENACYSHDLSNSYSYFEASARDSNIKDLSLENRVFGSIAAFAIGNFASSKVLIDSVDVDFCSTPLQRIITETIKIILGKDSFESYKSSDQITSLLKLYFSNVIDFPCFRKRFIDLECLYVAKEDEVYFYFLYMVMHNYEKNKSSHLLPLYSGINSSLWQKYLTRPNHIKMLWQSQKLIGDAGFLKGKSGAIALPTGTGKTKSIELIIQSRLLKGDCGNVLIVAPLRALCNKIKSDLTKCFGRDSIKNISDANIEDFDVVDDSNDFKIVVITPEKLYFILHHDIQFLSSFGLLVFDEAHMIEDSSRGGDYELLLTCIKRMRVISNQQIVLITAVIDNISDLFGWFFKDDEKAAMVNSKNLFVADKTLSFYRSDIDRLLFYEDISLLNNDEPYFIPRFINKISKEIINKNDKYTVAVATAESLSLQDPVVLFLPQSRSIPAFLQNRYLLTQSDNNSHENEKINIFIKNNYGNQSPIYLASKKGYYPHYGDMLNGVRLLIEDGVKRKIIRKLVATSTLAEGVNMPIKNMIIIGTNVSKERIARAKFKNICGRAARLDKYTNGNIISLEMIGNNKKTKILHQYKSYFDDETPIRCHSSFNSEYLIEYLNTNNVNFSAIEKMVSLIGDKSAVEELKCNNKFFDWASSVFNIMQASDYLSKLVEIIQNYLPIEFKEEDFNFCYEAVEVLVNIVRDTYAFYLANNEQEKIAIIALYLLTFINASVQEEKTKKMFFVATFKKKYIDVISTWLENYSLDSENICNEALDLFYNGFILPAYTKKQPNSIIQKNEFMLIFNLWINGATICEIANHFQDHKILNSTFAIEKFVKKEFDYNFPYFMSSIMDSLAFVDDVVSFSEFSLVSEKQKCIENLTNMINASKYGLSNKLMQEFYINIFQDRFCAKALFDVLDNTEISFDQAIKVIKANKKKIINKLGVLPSFFIDQLNFYLN